MPPPMVTCSICKKEVLKAQTYFVGNNNRACKTHEGVISTKDRLEIENKKKAEAERKAKEERLTKKAQESDPSFYMKPFCWCCKDRGIRDKEFYTTYLVLSEMEKLRGGCLNPFSPEYTRLIRAALGLKDGESTAIISVFEMTQDNPLFKKLDYNGRSVVQLGGIVALCQRCAQKHGFEKPPMQIDFATSISIYDAISPIFREVAKVALAKEAERN